jgi:multidrug efflux pump subunit AcrA (membrane-fusion protein)
MFANRSLWSAFLRSLLLVLLSSVTSQGQDSEEARPKKTQKEGVFFPAESSAVELWPRVYRGEFVILEVLPHGSFVNKRDVVARLDSRSIEQQLEDAELDLTSATVQYANLVARGGIDAQADEATRDKAKRSVELAKRRLKAWEGVERNLEQRSADLSKQRVQHRIDDQVDELTQLEAMYREDELTDATEEIVLMRSRRNLASSQVSQKLSLDRRQHTVETDLVEKAEELRLALYHLKGELDRLLARQSLEERSRADSLQRSEASLERKREHLQQLQRDRELFELRAPNSGLLLHGSVRDYAPGKTPPRHHRGGKLSSRAAVFTVAESDRLRLGVAIPESLIAELTPGMAVEVHPTTSPERTLVGRLQLERFPDPASASAKENTYAAVIEFDGPLAGLLPGMRGKATLTAAGKDEGEAGTEGGR